MADHIRRPTTVAAHINKMDHSSRSHKSNNYGTHHGTVLLLLKFDLTYDDLPTSDL